MRKLFTVKPERTIGLFLLLGIVALQWSFTSAATGENHAAHFLPDTSVTPVAGKAVTARNKPAAIRPNRRTNTSKPVLASNLEPETISFGNPTGGPDNEVGSSKTSNRKTAVISSVKAIATRNANPENTVLTGAKSEGATRINGTAGKTVVNGTSVVSAGTKGTPAGKKTIDVSNTSNTKGTSPKSESTLNIKAASTGKKNVDAAGSTNTAGTKSAGAKTAAAAASAKKASSFGMLAGKLKVYDSLHLRETGLSKKIFTLALKGMSQLMSTRHIKNNLLSIVDYSQPSNRKRLYVIDLNNYQLLYNTYVAHGMNTGKQIAQYFSNKPSSNKSSLGFYITGAAYRGINGYSLKLTGVEKGINDHAMDRGIVIHGADYVCEGLIESQGYIGRSWGCPAVAPEISQELIDLLKGGSCLFIYHSSPAYRTKSALLK